MRNGFKGKRSGMQKVALPACLFACLLMVLAAVLSPLWGGSRTAFGEETSETSVQTEITGRRGEELPAQTEASGDGVETWAEKGAAGELPAQTEAYGGGAETESESGGILSGMGDVVGLVLTEDMQQELSSISIEEAVEYVRLLQSVLLNPEFQSLFEYEEVRDLVVTLIGNALRFAAEDPMTTNKILTTMGVDRRVIIFFFALLEGWEDNPGISDKVVEFMMSKQGAMLIELILTKIDQETVENAMESLNAITMTDSSETKETEIE